MRGGGAQRASEPRDHVSVERTAAAATAARAEPGEMVRCCRSLHSPSPCFNLRRVRVDVRRLRLLSSRAAGAEQGPGGSGGASQGVSGVPALSHRTRFRYGGARHPR